MKGTAAVSLSNLSKVSPNKRKPPQSSDSKGAIKPRAIIEEGGPNWPCPSPGCPGRTKTVKKKEGGQFGSCDHRVYGDKDSCRVTTTLLQRSSVTTLSSASCATIQLEALLPLANQLTKKTSVDTPVSPLFSSLRDKNENKRLTGVSTLVLFFSWFAKGRSASNWTVAHEAELRVVTLLRCRSVVVTWQLSLSP